MEPLVMGIDTNSRSLHFVTSQPVHQLKVRYAFLESGHPNIDLARAEIFRLAKEMFSFVPFGSHVFCEEPLALAKNPATTRLLCMSAGAIFAAFVASYRDATWHWVNPASWKKEVLGRGAPPVGQKHKPWIAATLDNMPEFQEWMKAVRGPVAASFEAQPDYRDAWCLMTYGTRVVQSL